MRETIRNNSGYCSVEEQSQKEDLLLRLFVLKKGELYRKKCCEQHHNTAKKDRTTLENFDFSRSNIINLREGSASKIRMAELRISFPLPSGRAIVLVEKILSLYYFFLCILSLYSSTVILSFNFFFVFFFCILLAPFFPNKFVLNCFI